MYVLFDLLWLDGHSLMASRTRNARAQLLGLGLTGASWQTPPHEVGDGAATHDVSKRFGLEGVVAKRVDSPYEPGRRSRSWLKLKNTTRQEFVVGGWMPGEKGRTGSIGSLLIGYYDDGVLAATRHASEVACASETLPNSSVSSSGARATRARSPKALPRRARAGSSPCSSST